VSSSTLSAYQPKYGDRVRPLRAELHRIRHGRVHGPQPSCERRAPRGGRRRFKTRSERGRAASM
jgi:hypothetical protein